MYTVTTAIIAALAAGIIKSSSTVGENAIVDAYGALKAIIKRKFGSDSKVVKAVNDFEEEPDSEGYKAVLKEQVEKAKVHQDSEVLATAQVLLGMLQAQSGSEQAVQQATGNYIAQAAQGSSANVNIMQPKES
jgi:hypothetical protein